MGRKLSKAVAIVAIGGMALQFGACGSKWWQRILSDAALSAAYEWLWDNDAIFDLFQDDFGTAVFYNDRNADDPSRAEP
jgi:hypothetical protein